MDQIGTLLDRPKAYYNIDGVGELGGGFMLLAWALLTWLQVHAPRASVWHSVWMLCIYVGLMSLIIRYGSKAIKNHITYPRTGFVEYHTSWRPAIAAGVVSAVLVVGLAFARRSQWEIPAPATIFGLLFAASYARAFARTVRWKWAVVCLMAAGSLAIAKLPADLILDSQSWITTVLPEKLEAAFLLLLLFYGPLLMVSGGISFWLYLRHTQSPAQELP
jgi:hypothetical protein